MSSTGGLCIFACIFLSIIGEVEGVVSYPPSNTVAEVNGEAIFNCSAVPSGPLAWVLTRDGIPGAGEIRITFGCIVNAGFQNHYKTEQPGGPTTCNLIVLNITMEQAGVYHCTDTDTYRAQLTVLDSSPGITYNNTPDVIEKENVVFTCTLNFNGSVEPAPSLRPHFYWTDYTGRNVSSFNDSWPGNDSAVSQLSVTAGRQDIMPYTCHVYLKLIPTTTPMYASNTPTVTSSASSPPIGVLYSPGNISIASSVSPQDECVQQQESLTCTADAKPQAQYEWLDLNSNTMSNGSVKYIISGGQYQCTAYNYLRTKIHNDTKTTTEAKCYPVTENNMTITGCTKDSCYCTGNQPLALTCQVYSVPKATYQWWKDDQKYSANQTIPVTHNGNYSCTARNSIGTNSSEATVSTSVFNCTEPPTTMSTTTQSTTKLSTTDPTATLPSVTPTRPPSVPIPAVVGGVIGCILAVNIIATLIFIIYYNAAGNPHSATNDRSGHSKTKRNKTRLNKRFPWLQKMLPCLNETKEGTNCLWVSLFVLLGTLTGVATFPFCICLALKSEKNLETSALNQRENGEENGSAANGRRSVNSPHSPSQPGNHTRTVNPYQNESRENIELSSSHHSRNLLLTDCPTSSTSPKGKPPPPPNKPTPNTPNTPGRAHNYVVTEPATMDPDHTTYADLPFMPHVPSTRPVQYLDGTEDAYAELKKT